MTDVALGEVYGIKYLNRDERGRFISPTQRYIWKPGKNVACKRDAVREYSGDGFYSLMPDKQGKYGTWSGTHPTIIKHTGATVLGDKGYRSEFGEIVAVVDQSVAVEEAEGFARKWGKFIGWVGRHFVVQAILGLLTALTITFSFGNVEETMAFSLLGLLVAAGLFAILIESAESRDNDLSLIEKQKYQYSVAELYPDVTIYPSLKEMLKDERLPRPEPPKEVTPADPEFWEDEEAARVTARAAIRGTVKTKAGRDALKNKEYCLKCNTSYCTTPYAHRNSMVNVL